MEFLIIFYASIALLLNFAVALFSYGVSTAIDKDRNGFTQFLLIYFTWPMMWGHILTTIWLDRKVDEED
jgi:hypothetical protein